MRHLAEQRHLSVSELVRLALNSCYQIEILNLKATEKQALEAFRGGNISLGKLGQVMGMHPLKLRQWLDEHNIPENNSYSEKDVEHA
ncbi:MAG: UPF0175 family protein [Candidatus Protochlamydia sp.]|nr:UPF0175 family protein [Candidatus Protochlamydia sp.]